jgi:2-hydroxychromene-2-carboxylate isomerase
MSDALTVYFSLRSPYSWLALHRLSQLGDGLGAPLELVPVFPRGDTNVPDPATNHAKFRYMLEDVLRVSQAYGLALRPPASLDTRWELSHAAVLYAQEEGLGLEFSLAAASARFTRSRDLGSIEVLEEIATIVGLDAARVGEAAQDPARHGRVYASIERSQKAGVIGVPFFVWQGQHFWGNDRMDWLLREMDRARNIAVSELTGPACLAPAWMPERK